MNYTGNIRKMHVFHNDADAVDYKLPLMDNLNEGCIIALNNAIGSDISLRFEHQINCVVTGKKINKTFGDGLSYDAFMNSPLGCPSIMKPELSLIHTGVALRDEKWERENHLQPHIVYLSKTSGVKVGVTRKSQIPTRWIDQGATEAIVLAETPYRQLAGLIEVRLKNFIQDKTNWQQMLKNSSSDDDLVVKKIELINLLNNDFSEYISKDNSITKFNYPVLRFPEKVMSLKLDKTPIIEKKLIGIKGQYLLFDDASVFNVRSHSGYLITLEL